MTLPLSRRISALLSEAHNVRTPGTFGRAQLQLCRTVSSRLRLQPLRSAFIDGVIISLAAKAATSKAVDGIAEAMRLQKLALLGVLFAAAGRCYPQQQTGSPAGVPVPTPPATPATRITGGEMTGSMIFRVRVVDGRNGAPMPNAHVKLWYDEPAGSGYQFATDVHGVGEMPAPVGDPVRVLATVVDYIDCRKPLRGDPPAGYNLSGIAKTGVATQNTCGRISIHTQPGELVLFVRSPHWYESLNRGSGS